MLIKDAQREMRLVYLAGAVGQGVSGVIWLLSAGMGTWLNPQAALILLTLGGVFIFPLTQLVLKLSGHKATTSKQNPFSQLATQVAFIVPLCLPLIGVTASYNVNYFYPAFMVVVGAHYLPFMFLYGIWQFAILGGLLMGGGTFLMMTRHTLFITGGWFTAGVLLLFAGFLWFIYQREKQSFAEKVAPSL